MNWNERINAAEKRRYFSTEDKFFSQNWTTCACGEQDIELLDEDGLPKDHELKFLGAVFCAVVCENDFEQARSVLYRINKRAAELLEFR